MIEIFEFNLLTFEQKCEVIQRRGIYLVGRNEDNLGYNLYAISSFYVEVCFNFSDDYLDKIKVFKDIAHLEPYISEIDLNISSF